MRVKQWIKRLAKKHPPLYKALHRMSTRARDFKVGLKRLNANGWYMRRRFLISDEKLLIYLSNAKVASSSINASMGAMGDVDNYLAVHRALAKRADYLPDIDIDDYPGYYKFTFVRDPFRRLLSCYENKYHTDVALSGGAAKRLYRESLYFDNYLLGFLKRDRGFKAFARRVCAIPDRLADQHFVSQDFLIHDRRGRKLVDFVGKMEDLPQAYEPIRAQYGLAPLPHYNRTGGEGNWMDAYDLKTARKVRKRYARDIEAFGYRDSADALIAYLAKKEAQR